MQVECVLVFEVWNESKIVHQAEGPLSDMPSKDALRAMEIWGDAQGVRWDMWEMW
jgi:hypothetical protein